jgi:long-chain acyl-CoA synthetase
MIEEGFSRIVRQYPDSIALVDDEVRLTYAGLAMLKARVVKRLKEDLHLGRGDRIAVHLPNSREFIVTFFGLAEMGAVCVPLNTQWRAEELEWCARSLKISAVITNADLRRQWDSLQVVPRERLMCLGEADGLPDVADRSRCRSRAGNLFEDDEVLYLMTSGSTGRPKAVPRSQRNLIAGARNVAQALRTYPGQKFLGVVPLYHANGFANCMFLPLMHGATVVLMRKFIPARLAELVRREKVQVLIASPFIFSMQVESGQRAEDFKSVEICLSSGAQMSRELVSQCADRLGLRVRQLYGSSEAGTVAIESAECPDGSRTVGRPLPLVEVKIIGSDDSQLQSGAEGEIVVKSPAMMKGYVEEPAQSGDFFCHGFLRTGDLGRFDEHGNLVISGRAKRIINLCGIKVDPVEIENIVKAMPGVQECLVLAVKNLRQMEIIKAMVAVRPGHFVSRKQIVEHCRMHLAEYKIPRVIEFVHTVAQDLMGKVRIGREGESNGISDS